MSCSTPPFSSVVGSGPGWGVNVGSRVIRAGFTGTRRVLVSAVPSAGVGGPAPLLGGPGVEVVLPIGGGGDHKRRQTPVDTDPATIIGRIARLVLVGGVQVGGHHIQRHPPPPAVLADGGEQNRGAVFGDPRETLSDTVAGLRRVDG